MHLKTVAIVFGGDSPEHDESIKATRLLYQHAIRKLSKQYRFRYFFILKSGKWATASHSRLALFRPPKKFKTSVKRVLNLVHCDVIYSTMMGSSGESGDLIGLASMLQVPIVGCDIDTSALGLNKYLAKVAARAIRIPTLDDKVIHWNDTLSKLIDGVDEIGYPCIVKPTNLGTCQYIFRADNNQTLIRRWISTSINNHRSDQYLLEPFIHNVEVRVFIYQDGKKNLVIDDGYVTTLRENVLDHGGTLFNVQENTLPTRIRKRITRYAIRFFTTFMLKDYARLDFFVTPNYDIYFNEVNTQPFIGVHNIELMERRISYKKWFVTMIENNL